MLRRAFAPFSLFLFALLLRVIGLDWGLPNAGRWGSYHPDESVHQMVGAIALHILGGDWNPHFFNYPSLCIYATTVIYWIMAALGLTTVAAPSAYPWALFRDIIFAGRLLSVVCGATTAVCVWGMAREAGMRRGALFAGALAALCPGLVQHSHFATVDVPATFLVAACAWATMRAAHRPASTRGWIGAAILAGLAAGAKYNAGLIVLAPLVALLVARGDGGSEKPASWLLPATPFVALLAFLVTTPYALLAPSEFWGNAATQSGFGYELLVHPREGSGEIFTDTGLGWWVHLTFNLPFVLTWPLLVAGLWGAVAGVKERRHWPLLAFALAYFLIIGASNVRFMRYTFLLVPMLLVWIPLGLRRLPKPDAWAGFLFFFAFAGAKDALFPLIQPDPRDKAAAYMKAVGGTPTLVGNPWYYTPPFQPRNDNSPVVGVKIVGWDTSKLVAETDTLAVSQYEVREALRLRPNGPEAKFWAVAGRGVLFDSFNKPLPGRNFEPHDYLYTHPRVWVLRLR